MGRSVGRLLRIAVGHVIAPVLTAPESHGCGCCVMILYNRYIAVGGRESDGGER